MASSQNETVAGGAVQLSVGVECLLNVTGRHFLVKVLETENDVIRVSFPGKDYPIEGMRGEVEFHDGEGFFFYPIEVVNGPMHKGSGIAFRCIDGLKRNKHRDACRVPTDLTVQVRDESHARRYNADLINISAGGAFIRTEAPFDFSTVVELALSLPGEASHSLRCQVVDLLPGVENARPAGSRYCLRFVDPDAEAERCITQYVWERLRHLFPSQ